MLKLALLRREPDFAEVRPIIVFASEEARSSITGWVKRAAEVFDVELHVVDIDPELRAEIVATQELQKMVNVPLPSVADDITHEDQVRQSWVGFRDLAAGHLAALDREGALPFAGGHGQAEGAGAGDLGPLVGQARRYSARSSTTSRSGRCTSRSLPCWPWSPSLSTRACRPELVDPRRRGRLLHLGRVIDVADTLHPGALRERPDGIMAHTDDPDPLADREHPHRRRRRLVSDADPHLLTTLVTIS